MGILCEIKAASKTKMGLTANDMLMLALVFPAMMLIFRKELDFNISGIGRMKWSYLDSHWNILRDLWTSLNRMYSTYT